MKNSHLVLSCSLRVIAQAPVLGHSWWEEREAVCGLKQGEGGWLFCPYSRLRVIVRGVVMGALATWGREQKCPWLTSRASGQGNLTGF